MAANYPSTRPFYESVEWRITRCTKMADARGRCEACGSANPRNIVHHKRPVRMFPQLGLDYGNLIVLCPGCHDALHAVCLSRTLLNLVDIYRDPRYLTARRLDFGPVPIQFGFHLEEPAANEEWTLDPVIQVPDD